MPQTDVSTVPTQPENASSSNLQPNSVNQGPVKKPGGKGRSLKNKADKLQDTEGHDAGESSDMKEYFYNQDKENSRTDDSVDNKNRVINPNPLNALKVGGLNEDPKLFPPN